MQHFRRQQVEILEKHNTICMITSSCTRLYNTAADGEKKPFNVRRKNVFKHFFFIINSSHQFLPVKTVKYNSANEMIIDISNLWPAGHFWPGTAACSLSFQIQKCSFYWSSFYQIFFLIFFLICFVLINSSSAGSSVEPQLFHCSHLCSLHHSHNTGNSLYTTLSQ